MIVREAEIEDWNILSKFFLKIYRKDHPLHVRKFWSWQYGDKNFGRSFIFINDQGEVAGHVGANFGGGIAWIINVYLLPENRGQGILRKLYDLARKYFPLGATAANEAGLGLYRNMRWIRYHNLVRYVKINPQFDFKNKSCYWNPVEVRLDSLTENTSHYFKQPGIKGLHLPDGSRGVSQDEVGGLRLVDLVNIKELEEHTWSLGYLWMDYVTSWNDLEINNLIKNHWVSDVKSEIPWRLNPVVENYFCNISFLSEKPLSNEFIVHRSFSDHGRVGSLK